MTRIRRLLSPLLLAAALMAAWPAGAETAAPAASAVTLPAASLYWVSAPLTDSQGRHFSLRDMAGHPMLLTMFYGDCSTACPIVLENLRNTVSALAPVEGQFSVLLISLDNLHDTPAKLARLAASHHLDPSVFRLAASDSNAHTRAIATALGIKYRALSNGEINHTTRLVLLDAGGTVIASNTTLGTTPDPAFLAKIRAVLNPG